jgi:hypothetical protein
VKISGTPDAPAEDLPHFQLNGFGWQIWRRHIAR